MRRDWGGIFNGSKTLEEMIIFAKAKIWSHLDGVMAVAGAGGCKTSAFCNGADDCIQNVLKQVVGHWSLKCKLYVLRVEYGILLR